MIELLSKDIISIYVNVNAQQIVIQNYVSLLQLVQKISILICVKCIF